MKIAKKQENMKPNIVNVMTIFVLSGLVLTLGIIGSLIVENTGVSLVTWSLACSTCLASSVTTALIIWNSASNLSCSLIIDELTRFKFESLKKDNLFWISSNSILFNSNWSWVNSRFA